MKILTSVTDAEPHLALARKNKNYGTPALTSILKLKYCNAKFKTKFKYGTGTF
jgi:hypothetical protein